MSEVVTKNSLIAEALARQTKPPEKLVELAGDFPEQNNFVNDTSKFIAAQCSRRAGKTNGLAYKFLKTLEKYPGSQCLYIGLTLESARDIMWPVLQEINERFTLNCVFTESKLEMKHPNGARLKLVGADHKNFIKRLKGRKFPGVAIDEAQDFGSHLQSLVDDVLTPSISDYADGWLAMTGTPGPVPQGYFFEVTHEGKYGYKTHKWTLLENPFMPNPEQFISDLISKREWKSDNPTLLREYRNQWVLDANSLWVQYDAEKCDYKDLPVEHKWVYILGVDIGYNDADAIAVLAWSSTSTDTYLVEELIKPRQGITALMTQVEELQKKYDVYKIMFDSGGGGRKAFEDYIPRFGIPVVPADKQRKQTNVDFLNDAMRLGKFKAKKESRFATDSYLVQIDWDKSTPDRIVIKKKPHSDIIDAVLYAFRESMAHTYEAPPPPGPAVGSPAWGRKQQNDLFEAALANFGEKSDENPLNTWVLKGK